MKKNIRLVSVISLILIIIYFIHFVNECNQLRNTFSSFLVPSDSGSVKPCLVVNETIQTYEHVNLFDSPLPLWNKVGDVYVYSAYWSQLKDSFAAVAIGVGPSVLDASLYKCHVWFDFKNIIHSVTGNFRVIGSLSAEDEVLSVYNFLCQLDEDSIKGKPYMFVILNNSAQSGEVKKSFIPIFYKLPIGSSQDKLAICVLPDRVGVGKSEIIEFISFHQLIGLSDLIIYGNDINYGIIQKVKQLLGIHISLRSISIIPWNFPYDNKSLELQLLETDCLLRTSKFTRAFTILDWDQYIVPKQLNQLLLTLNVIDTPSTINFKFKSEICCIEQRNDKRSESSWPVVLQKTLCTDYPFYFIFKINGKNSVSTENVIQSNSSLVTVKTYRECTSLKNVKSRYDPSPFKFLSGLLSSNLLRLWNSGNLF